MQQNRIYGHSSLLIETYPLHNPPCNSTTDNLVLDVGCLMLAAANVALRSLVVVSFYDYIDALTLKRSLDWNFSPRKKVVYSIGVRAL